jgi:hypothetical protein
MSPINPQFVNYPLMIFDCSNSLVPAKGLEQPTPLITNQGAYLAFAQEGRSRICCIDRSAPPLPPVSPLMVRSRQQPPGLARVHGRYLGHVRPREHACGGIISHRQLCGGN